VDSVSDANFHCPQSKLEIYLNLESVEFEHSIACEIFGVVSVNADQLEGTLGGGLLKYPAGPGTSLPF
jgi:hypothetical protein